MKMQTLLLLQSQFGSQFLTHQEKINRLNKETNPAGLQKVKAYLNFTKLAL